MTNTRIEIELAPYKLRPRGSRVYEVVLNDEVIGHMSAFRRLVDRKPVTQYRVMSAQTGFLGIRDNVDDAADLVYDTHCRARAEATGAVPTADELWVTELEFIARLHLQSILSWEQARYALVLWRVLQSLPALSTEALDEALRDAVRKVAGL